ncbi:hypothetical protein D9M73_126450 [compost metagenome]
MSGSVPLAKVAEMLTCPRDDELVLKYSKPSMPVSCCSITWATDVSSVSADAPG